MTARALLLALLAAAGASAVPASAQIKPADAACGNCGVVQSIAPVSERQQWTPLGSIPEAGAMGGGPAGRPGSATMVSIGPGFTNRGMVVVGAAGGAAYAQKPNEYQRQRWDVTIKMDSGPPPRVLNLAYEPLVQEGDRVRVFGNQLELVNP
jgi:outer membrane lipoprotein SlyB